MTPFPCRPFPCRIEVGQGVVGMHLRHEPLDHDAGINLAVQAVAILETGDMARGSRTDERLENELSQEPSLGSSSLVVERNDLVAIGVDNSRHSHPFFILSGFTSRWIGPVLSLGGHANELRTA